MKKLIYLLIIPVALALSVCQPGGPSTKLKVEMTGLVQRLRNRGGASRSFAIVRIQRPLNPASIRWFPALQVTLSLA